MNNLILHKIVIYLKKKPSLAKLFFYINDYRLLVNTSNSHFDELYALYGTKKWDKIIYNLRSTQAIFRLNSFLFLNYEIVIAYASEQGHLETVKWLHKEFKRLHIDQEIGPFAMNWASKNGHLEVLKWLHDNDYNCSANAIDDAAKYGHFKVVKWLLERIPNDERNQVNTEFTPWAIIDAAKYNHIEIVKFLYLNRKNHMKFFGRFDDNDLFKHLDDFTAINGLQYAELIIWLHNN